ncbi:MAG TPA: hypothetical protein VFN78_03630 [Ktedonobacterales bacterium]|nr:hypothetical protein [Ktedonobacterales bacterium]
MGWFSKKRSPSGDQGRKAASEPFVADDQVVAHVARLMVMWNDAVGNDAKMRATASGISSAAGVDDRFYMSGAWIDNPAVLRERPWQMLAAVALRASVQGDYVLAARIFSFTSFWGRQIAPHLRPADWFDMRLADVPPAIEVEIAAIGFRSLQQLPSDQVIFSNTTGSVDTGALSVAAASALTEASEKGFAVDAADLTVARGILGQS